MFILRDDLFKLFDVIDYQYDIFIFKNGNNW